MRTEAEAGIRITSHMAGMVIPEVTEDGVVFFRVMPYTKARRTTLRHPVETGDAGDENVTATIERGLKEEVVADPANFRFEIDSRPVFCEFVSDERHPGGKHLKAFFLVKVEGALRDREKQDGDEILGPMQRIEARQFLREVAGHSIPSHRAAACGALARLATNRLVFDRYGDIIWRSPVPELTKEETTALTAYMG